MKKENKVITFRQYRDAYHYIEKLFSANKIDVLTRDLKIDNLINKSITKVNNQIVIVDELGILD